MAFGIGKVLGLAALGVAAVAAAPFTGGGSIAGAATLAGSLAGAEALAVGAAVAGGAAGAVLSRREEEEKERKEKEIAKANQKAKNFEEIAKEHQNHTEYILALSALGISIANADGEISEEEMDELNEFVGGLAAKKYPSHIIEAIDKMKNNPPTFNDAIKYLEKVNEADFDILRNVLLVITEADGKVVNEEKAFIEAFDRKVSELRER